MRIGLWDTALKFLSPGPRNDVTDHLVVNTAANHLDTACTSLLDMCKRCQAETVKIGEGILALNWEIVVSCFKGPRAK